MGKNSIVKDIVEYIEDHLDEDLSLDRIASEMNYSKFYIARVFAKETMTSFPECCLKELFSWEKRSVIPQQA